MAPVGGVAVGVAPEGHAAAAAEHHTHGPPEALLPPLGSRQSEPSIQEPGSPMTATFSASMAVMGELT